MDNLKSIDKFVKDQLSVWPLAAANFRALKSVQTRDLEVGGLKVRLQHNPARIRSSAVKLDEASVKAARCFLCAENRPAEQRALPFEGRKGRKYNILVNLYPIFPDHLVIASELHEPQSIWKRVVDMTDIARHYPGYTVFYNGPRCGASAPYHMHFQACPSGLMPLETEIDSLLSAAGDDAQGSPAGLKYVTSVQDASVYHYGKFTRGVFALKARTSKSFAKLFYRLLDCMPAVEGDSEPRFNLLLWYAPGTAGKASGISHGRFGEYRAIFLARESHRSHHYFSTGPDHLTMSPGCADMAGLFIVPDADDYAKLDSAMLEEMLSEVSVTQETEQDIIWKLTRRQPVVEVGVMSGKEIAFEIISDGAGVQKVRFESGRISYNGTLYDELLFDAVTMSSMFAEPSFILYGVTIGVDFHWQRRMTQKFAGSLKFIVTGDGVTAVNIVGAEDYLLSVIASEMKADAPLELLKAHAVISRSWLLSKILARRSGSPQEGTVSSDCMKDGVRRYVRWFENEDHTDFDVCADDHCQRYQGLGMAVGENVRRAIDSTWAEVLMWGGEICDARFSKCCGGVTERFSTCWGDRDYPYLESVPDVAEDASVAVAADLTVEENAENWCSGTPGAAADAFCNTSDRGILSAVLNDYDMETGDFFRWRTEYTRAGLSELIRERSGVDIGLLKSLEPVRRGPSGRIMELRISGTRTSMVIGKELLIRKYLSRSHLKSSAFTVSVEPGRTAEEDVIILKGAGWGHGVGLCQIGAAVMACKGYGYKSILRHYYPGAEPVRRPCAESGEETGKGQPQPGPAAE